MKESLPATALRKAFKLSRLVRMEAKYAYYAGIRGETLAAPPVFIVGCGHSGTSLVLAILGTHTMLQAVPFESNVIYKPADEQERLLKQFEKMTVSNRRRRWVEKTPRHILKIGEILQRWPDAKVVIVLRDGRDVACSLRARQWDFKKAVQRWIDDNKAGQEHWESPQVRVLRYEDIIVDFRSTIQKLMEFIGEPYEERMERYYESPKRYYDWRILKPNNPMVHERYRNWQINQPLFDSRGKWKESMSAQDRETFSEMANSALIEFGYETSADW